MDLQLKGKRALITGGSGGMGKAIARAFLDEGVRVVVAARNADRIKQAAAELAAASKGEAHGLTVDTMDDASVNALIAAAVEKLGGIDIVVNTAASPGAVQKAPGVANLTSEFILEHINTKLVGYLRVARAAAPYLTANGWGRIINLGGLASRLTVDITGSARAVAVVALTKNLADELSPKGVNVTVVHPGPTRTEGTAEYIREASAAAGITTAQLEKQLASATLLGRLIDVEEVAAVVTFLASPKSAAITGDAIAAGGGVPKSIHY